MRACLEDEVAFGVEDESAHVGDGGSAAGQKHAEDQADVGFGALDQIVEDLSVLDLPQGDAVGGNRPFNVLVDLDADGVAGGVVQDLNDFYAANLEEDVEAAGGTEAYQAYSRDAFMLEKRDAARSVVGWQ